MDYDKVKVLDNYQIYQLIQNESIDKELVAVLQKEFDSRFINNIELNRLKAKYEDQFTEEKTSADTTNLNPVFTPFLLKTHFQNIAILKTNGKKKEAKTYQLKLNIGLILEGVIVVVLVFLYYR